MIRTYVPDGETFEFDHGESFLSFDFAVLDFGDPARNQFAYRMVGLDSDWTYSGTRSHADYPDLRRGTYTFEVDGDRET